MAFQGLEMEISIPVKRDFALNPTFPLTVPLIKHSVKFGGLAVRVLLPPGRIRLIRAMRASNEIFFVPFTRSFISALSAIEHK
jgi:hypothetical protein